MSYQKQKQGWHRASRNFHGGQKSWLLCPNLSDSLLYLSHARTSWLAAAETGCCHILPSVMAGVPFPISIQIAKAGTWLSSLQWSKKSPHSRMTAAHRCGLHNWDFVISAGVSGNHVISVPWFPQHAKCSIILCTINPRLQQDFEA